MIQDGETPLDIAIIYNATKIISYLGIHSPTGVENTSNKFEMGIEEDNLKASMKAEDW